MGELDALFGSMVVGGMGGSVVVGVGGNSWVAWFWEHVVIGLLDCVFDWLSYCCCKDGSFDGISGGGGLVTVLSMM